MKLSTLAKGETWMTEYESAVTRRLVNNIRTLLKNRGVVETPLIALRVSDLVVAWILARRLEDALAPHPVDDHDSPTTTPAQVEAIGKSRERLRKSIKELEEYCSRAGTPIDTGLADSLKPVIQQVQGTNPFLTPS